MDFAVETSSTAPPASPAPSSDRYPVPGRRCDAATALAAAGGPAPSLESGHGRLQEPSRHAPFHAGGRAIHRFFAIVGEAVARWTRLDYEGPDRLPDPPALIVANHGFGGIFDLNAFTIGALAARLNLGENAPLTFLTHQLAWTLGVGRFLEPAGFRPASREAALAGFAAGGYVLVMPGGDLDAGKSFSHRNEIVFGGRTGYAKIALEAGVPIVPIVVSGAGETLLVLSDGQRLAERLNLPALTRLKTLPISISLPYGLSVGVAGMLPYLPLPAKMRAAVLDPIRAQDGETADALAARVHTAMSSKLTQMTEGRVPFLGVKWDDLLGQLALNVIPAQKPGAAATPQPGGGAHLPEDRRATRRKEQATRPQPRRPRAPADAEAWNRARAFAATGPQ